MTTARSGPDIFGAEFIRDPYPQYQRMRDHHPLYFHAGSRAYIVSRYDDVRSALVDPNFTTRSYAAQIEPLLGVTLVQRDGQDHARERRPLAAPFRADRFHVRFAAAIEGVADELIASFCTRREVELIDAFITPFAVGVLAAVIGLPRADTDRFRAWYTALLRFGMNLAGDPAVTKAGLDARDEPGAYLRPLVTTAQEGLLGLLAADGLGLTDDEIVRAAMLMVFAGGETVEKTLATFIRNLLAHPGQLARVQADRSLIDRALAESLRFTAPTHMVPRRTQGAAALSGGEIPADAEVICFLAAANRDERRFAQPDTFDIDRPGNDGVRAFTAAASHAAFGVGRHFCLGAIMAKTEIHIAVDRLLDALPDMRFAGTAPPDHGLFLRGPLRLDISCRVDRSVRVYGTLTSPEPGPPSALLGTIVVTVGPDTLLGRTDALTLIFAQDLQAKRGDGTPEPFPALEMRFTFAQDPATDDALILADNMGRAGACRRAASPQIFYPGRWLLGTRYDNRLEFGGGDFVHNTLLVTGQVPIETPTGAFLSWVAEISSESPAMGKITGIDWWTPELGAPACSRRPRRCRTARSFVSTPH